VAGEVETPRQALDALSLQLAPDRLSESRVSGLHLGQIVHWQAVLPPIWGSAQEGCHAGHDQEYGAASDCEGARALKGDHSLYSLPPASRQSSFQ
jgi:hypothetical protein